MHMYVPPTQQKHQTVMYFFETLTPSSKEIKVKPKNTESSAFKTGNYFKPVTFRRTQMKICDHEIVQPRQFPSIVCPVAQNANVSVDVNRSNKQIIDDVVDSFIPIQ